MAPKKFKRVVIDYPPVPTRKWRPPRKDHVPQPFNRKPIKRKPLYPKYHREKVSTLQKIWHSYRMVKDRYQALLNGDYSQYDIKFPFEDRGKQGPANCFIAIGYSKILEMPKWSSRSLNKILEFGEQLYKTSIAINKLSCNCTSPKEVHNTFYIDRYLVVLAADPLVIKGVVDPDAEEPGLKQKLRKAFRSCNYVILEMNTKYLAIWKSGGGFYVFDPNDRNTDGVRVREGYGTATIIKFTSFTQLVNDCLRNYAFKVHEDEIAGYTLTPIHIKKIEEKNFDPPPILEPRPPSKYEKIIDSCLMTKFPRIPDPKEVTGIPPAPPLPGPPEKKLKKKVIPKPKPKPPELTEPERESNTPSFNAVYDEERIEEVQTVIPPEKVKQPTVSYFRECVPNKLGIIRASYNQNDPVFSRHGGKQSLCNGVAAIAMLTLTKAKFWFPKILDEILITGELVYRQSIRQMSGDQILDFKTMIKKFKMSRYYFTPVINDMAVIGKLNSQTPSTLDLLPALEEFFADNDTGILRGPVTLAVWFEEDRYYMFDPNDRNCYGLAIPKGYQIGDNNQEIAVSEQGYACVLWFMNLHDLVALYLNNLERHLRRDHFIISKVEIKDFVELPDPWGSFIPVTPTKWILRGTFSQNNTRFSGLSRNTQCTAISTLACAYTKLKSVQTWDRSTIDYLLIEGDIYYNQCIASLKERNKFAQKMLMMCELLDNYNIEDKELIINIEECLINGVVSAPDNYEFPNLQKGIEEFFIDNISGVISAKNISVGIWKFEDYYFYFDSHSRGPEGYDDYSGTACLIRLSSIPELALQINSNFGIGKEEVYNIASVEAIFRERLPDGTIKPEFKAYTKLNDKKGILRSNMYQGDADKFDVNADKQTWPNILMSLAISKVFPSSLWNKSTIDELLMQGNELYIASKTDNYKEDLLKASQWEARTEQPNLDLVNNENILKEFNVGVYKVQMEIGTPLEGIFEIEIQIEEEMESGIPLSVTLYQALEEPGDPKIDPPPRREFILSSEHMTLGIWKEAGLYYLFDPAGKDPEGNFFGRELWSAKIRIADEGDYDSPTYNEDFDGEPPASNLSSKTKTALETSEIVPYSDDWDEDENVDELLSKMNVYQVDTSNHKACILMFASFEDICNHIVENVPPNKRGDAVKLYPTKTTTKPIMKETANPLNRELGNWYHFLGIDKERWILRGTLNLHSKCFPEANRGRQYSSMCVAACAYGRLYALPKYTSTTVDHIIKYGDKLHTAIRKLREKELRANSVELGLSELEIEDIVSCLEIRPAEVLKQFYMGNYLVMLTVNEGILEGDVKKDWLPKPKIDLSAVEADADAGGKGRKRGGRERGGRRQRGGRDASGKKPSSKRGGKNEPEPTAPTFLSLEEQAAGILGIQEAITKYFTDHQFGILKARGKSVSFWKLFDFYYLFDPEARSPVGTQEFNGNGCIMRFGQINQMIETIDKNLDKDGDNKFTIDEIIIHSKEGKRPDPEVTKVILKDPKITAYNEIADGKMILRGNFHQDHAKFQVPKSACGSTNAIVSVAMANIHKAATWTKLIIDEVLTNAFRLYKHSIAILGCSFNTWDDKLTLDLMCPEFKIGIKFITFKPIVEDIKRGVLKIKSTTIMNLRRGLEDFFLDYNYGVIESDYLQCGVWLENELYYLFDPNERGPTGLYTTGGRAALIIFKNLPMLAEHFLSNIPEEFHSWEYKITPVELIIKEIKPDRKPLKKCEILKKAEIDSLASAKPKPPRPKPPKSTVEISCEKNKSNMAFKGKPVCYCPDKGNITVKKKDKLNLLELSPEEKKEWARQKSEEKKFKQHLHIEACMRKCFYVLENGDAIVRAKYSQNSSRFSVFTRNKQSIPNCLVSLVMLRLHDPNTWSHANIEIVLDSGDLLYKDSYQFYRPTNPKLGLRNVLRKFYVLNLRFETVIYKPCLAGYCNYDEVYRSLLNFFMQDNAAILLGDSCIVSVFQKCCQYYMFDPHDRNMHGNLSCACHGAACLMRFESLENLVKKYIENVPSPIEKFIICAVKVEGVTPSDK